MFVGNTDSCTDNSSCREQAFFFLCICLHMEKGWVQIEERSGQRWSNSLEQLLQLLETTVPFMEGIG